MRICLTKSLIIKIQKIIGFCGLLVGILLLINSFFAPVGKAEGTWDLMEIFSMSIVLMAIGSLTPSLVFAL